jgi:putative tryptophan/tyrosine transport system substrate-binding protein
LQLLKELAAHTSRVAVLANPDNPTFGGLLDRIRPGADLLGIRLTRVGARSGAELPQAFTAIKASRADAILLVDDVVLAGSHVRLQILQWALNQRLPVVSLNARGASDGGLASLGTDHRALSRRAAFYVHRILGGAKPGDLPVERPTVYKLTVNRKTATALGLTVPQALLLRADEVIE